MPRPLPRRTPLVGPVCPTCEHPSCRTRRAQQLPRLGGHRAEFAHEHAQAAAVQARHRDLTIWWGEATQSFWVAGPAGLAEAADIDALLLTLRSHGTPRSTSQSAPDTDPPAARPWARPAMGPAPAPAPGLITTLVPELTTVSASAPASVRIRRDAHTGRRAFGRPRASTPA